MRVAFDSNVLTFFLDANQAGYDPDADLDRVLAPQRRAALRLWMYCDNPIVVPTVWRECEVIPDELTQRGHFTWMAYHLEEVREEKLDSKKVDTRAKQLEDLHPGKNDCRIVAECEDAAARVDTLVTFDSRLIGNLEAATAIKLATPDECWEEAGIPRGTRPQVRLEPVHPLFDATWLRW